MDKLIKKYLRGNLSVEKERELTRIFSHYGYRLDEDLPDTIADNMPDEETSVRMKAGILHRVKAPRKKVVKWHWAAAAAVLVGVLGIAVQLFLRQEKNTVSKVTWHTQANHGGGVMRVSMPDSSLIWLNAQSSVRYASDYNRAARTVYLDGEAYFEVTQDVTRPFTVRADSLQVTVLGTSFVVSNHGEEPYHQVSVVSGRVRSSVSGQTGTTKELVAGDCYRYDRKTGMVTVNNVTSDDATAWLTGTLIFKDEELGAVSRVLARRYGVTFRFSGDELKTQRVTLKIPNESIHTVLAVLQSVTGTEYRLVGNEVIIK